MANFNKVFLMGNLTRDPELRYAGGGAGAAGGGSAICKFGLA
ncbi:MAG: single-stranded DNA-binding protein, partial [Burkholderiales bacterium]|nr:single-stranded DNA-binding protein [Burkholderiales bacterium]